MAALKAQGILNNQISTLVESNSVLVARLQKLENYSYGDWTTKGPPGIPDTTASISDKITLTGKFRQSLDASREAYKKASHADSDKSSVMSRASRFSSLSALQFHSNLANSRVYRRVKRNESVMSFSTSALGSKAWSVFSGVSLSEVSVISAIALPLFSSDIDHPSHYTFGRVGVTEPRKGPLMSSSLYLDWLELIGSLDNWSIQSSANQSGVSPSGFEFEHIPSYEFKNGNINKLCLILGDPNFLMVFNSSLPRPSFPSPKSLRDFLPLIKKYSGDLGISERERHMIRSDGWQHDIWKTRPVSHFYYVCNVDIACAYD